MTCIGNGCTSECVVSSAEQGAYKLLYRFWSLKETNPPRMWPVQWQHGREGLGIEPKVTQGHTHRGHKSDPANQLPPCLTLGRLLCPPGPLFPFCRKSFLQVFLWRRTRRCMLFLLEVCSLGIYSAGWRRTMKLQRGSASLAAPFTCITWTSVRRMTPSLSTPPALERWVQPPLAYSFPPLFWVIYAQFLILFNILIAFVFKLSK